MHGVAIAAPLTSSKTTLDRIQSVDLLRGLVMVIMALDHIRDFFHADALAFSPEDLTRTSAILFLTRWITHFCAPAFVFLSGVSVWLSSSRRASKAEVSRHLFTRGLWLILLEWTVVAFVWSFNFRYEFVMLQVIWAIGWSMIVLAGLIWLPRPAIAAIALGMITLHNALDGIAPAQFGNMAWIWNLLHVPTMFTPGQTVIFVAYPLIPWIGVMAAGYCFGPILQMEETRRRAVLMRLGGALTAAFVVIRYLNMYGDPLGWATQSTAVMTVLSFVRTMKYPPSLLYLLMTLGPSILLLGLIDGVRVSENNPIRVFGRVPMFYYMAHLYLLRVLTLVFCAVRYGRVDYFLHLPGPLFGLPDDNFPKDWGYNLFEVYLIWIGVVAVLYLPCRWMMRLKQRSRAKWLSYI